MKSADALHADLANRGFVGVELSMPGVLPWLPADGMERGERRGELSGLMTKFSSARPWFPLWSHSQGGERGEEQDATNAHTSNMDAYNN